MDLVMPKELQPISMEECYEVTGGMSVGQAVAATAGIGSMAWALPIAIVCPVAGAGMLLVGAGLTINAFS